VKGRDAAAIFALQQRAKAAAKKPHKADGRQTLA
jgi:hypothetical protein